MKEQQQMKVIDLSPAQQANAQTAIQALEHQPVTVEQMICRGIDKGLPVDTMERLLAMRRELKAEQSKEAYDRAMAAFQHACPEIKKTKAVMHNNAVRYRYAPLEVIIEQIKETMAEHGFSHKEDAIVEPGWVTGICKVTHTAGHTESTSFKVPIDEKAFMNAAQKFASAFTFCKRYAFCAAFGIMTADEDDDSQATIDPKPAAPAQRIEHPRNQAPAAPQRQQAAAPEGEQVFPVCDVLMVAKKPGSKQRTDKQGNPMVDANGQPVIRHWNTYFIKFNDGLGEFEAITFDDKFGDIATAADKEQSKVRLVTKPGKKAGSKEIVSLERAEAPPATPSSDQASMNFDEQGNPVADIIP